MGHLSCRLTRSSLRSGLPTVLVKKTEPLIWQCVPLNGSLCMDSGTALEQHWGQTTFSCNRIRGRIRVASPFFLFCSFLLQQQLPYFVFFHPATPRLVDRHGTRITEPYLALTLPLLLLAVDHLDMRAAKHLVTANLPLQRPPIVKKDLHRAPQLVPCAKQFCSQTKASESRSSKKQFSWRSLYIDAIFSSCVCQIAIRSWIG